MDRPGTKAGVAQDWTDRMSQVQETAGKTSSASSGSGSGGAGSQAPAPGAGSPAGGGLFQAYKQEQGKWTRLGTFIGSALLSAWAAKFLYDQLQVFQGAESWRMIVTNVIPLVVLVALGGLSWWVSYGQRTMGDFMIATEGEMKKVNWSTRREVIGSTKVVILFTLLMAAYLFVVDVVFQNLFQAIGVLKGG